MTFAEKQIIISISIQFLESLEFGVVELSIKEVVLLRLACVHVLLVNTNLRLV